MTNYNKAIVEVLEIVKYLDDDLKKMINNDYLELLKKDIDPEYHFTINKNIPLYENDFLDETFTILTKLFKDNN